MYLQYNFTDQVRKWFLGHWRCFLCGANGSDRGGLELHHILGRVSNSIFNAALVCGECHSHMGHNQSEHHELFAQAAKFIKAVGYKPDDDDMVFLRDHFAELVSSETKAWISSLA